ncbi:MAG: hypothetical protein ACI9A2_002718 [Halioglobus sp.]
MRLKGHALMRVPPPRAARIERDGKTERKVVQSVST